MEKGNDNVVVAKALLALLHTVVRRGVCHSLKGTADVTAATLHLARNCPTGTCSPERDVIVQESCFAVLATVEVVHTATKALAEDNTGRKSSGRLSSAVMETLSMVVVAAFDECLKIVGRNHGGDTSRAIFFDIVTLAVAVPPIRVLCDLSVDIAMYAGYIPETSLDFLEHTMLKVTSSIGDWLVRRLSSVVPMDSFSLSRVDGRFIRTVSLHLLCISACSIEPTTITHDSLCHVFSSLCRIYSLFSDMRGEGKMVVFVPDHYMIVLGYLMEFLTRYGPYMLDLVDKDLKVVEEGDNDDDDAAAADADANKTAQCTGPLLPLMSTMASTVRFLLAGNLGSDGGRLAVVSDDDGSGRRRFSALDTIKFDVSRVVQHPLVRNGDAVHDVARRLGEVLGGSTEEALTLLVSLPFVDMTVAASSSVRAFVEKIELLSWRPALHNVRTYDTSHMCYADMEVERRAPSAKHLKRVSKRNTELLGNYDACMAACARELNDNWIKAAAPSQSLFGVTRRSGRRDVRTRLRDRCAVRMRLSQQDSFEGVQKRLEVELKREDRLLVGSLGPVSYICDLIGFYGELGSSARRTWSNVIESLRHSRGPWSEKDGKARAFFGICGDEVPSYRTRHRILCQWPHVPYLCCETSMRRGVAAGAASDDAKSATNGTDGEASGENGSGEDVAPQTGGSGTSPDSATTTDNVVVTSGLSINTVDKAVVREGASQHDILTGSRNDEDGASNGGSTAALGTESGGPSEEVLLELTCSRVNLMDEVHGLLQFTRSSLVFLRDPVSVRASDLWGGALESGVDTTASEEEVPVPSARTRKEYKVKKRGYRQLVKKLKKGERDVFSAGTRRTNVDPNSLIVDLVIPLSKLHVVRPRRYLLMESAFEVFSNDRGSYFFTVPCKERVFVQRFFEGFRIRGAERPWPMTGSICAYSTLLSSELSLVQRRWMRGLVSNFEYIMVLNTYSGRTYNDLTQYPVFPWILCDFSSSSLDLSDWRKYRDLSRPVGALTPARLDFFASRFDAFEHDEIPKFHYGCHYSSSAAVLFYLMRVEPYTSLHVKLQSGHFDDADRLFTSLPAAFKSCMTSSSDVKELIPEFFSNSLFLENVNGLQMGYQHDGLPVDDVILPPWAEGDSDRFVAMHRAALESDWVSMHLHLWIDLVFGHKQRGQAAIDAHNTFYFLTYEGAVDIEKIPDAQMREATIAQINNFGQTPSQLFVTPHPSREIGTSGEMIRDMRVDGACTAQDGSLRCGKPVLEPADVDAVKIDPVDARLMCLTACSKLLPGKRWVFPSIPLEAVSVYNHGLLFAFSFGLKSPATRLFESREAAAILASRRSSGVHGLRSEMTVIVVGSNRYYRTCRWNRGEAGEALNADTFRMSLVAAGTDRRRFGAVHAPSISWAGRPTNGVGPLAAPSKDAASPTNDSPRGRTGMSALSQVSSATALSVYGKTGRSRLNSSARGDLGPKQPAVGQSVVGNMSSDFSGGEADLLMSRTVLCSRDGCVIYSCGHWDMAIRVTRVETGEVVQYLPRHVDVVTHLCCSEDDCILVTGSRDTTLCVWKIDTDTQLLETVPCNVLYGHMTPITAVAVSSMNDIVVSSSVGGLVLVHSLGNSSLLAEIMPEPLPFARRGPKSLVTVIAGRRLTPVSDIECAPRAEKNCDYVVRFLLISTDGFVFVYCEPVEKYSVRRTRHVAQAESRPESMTDAQRVTAAVGMTDDFFGDSMLMTQGDEDYSVSGEIDDKNREGTPDRDSSQGCESLGGRSGATATPCDMEDDANAWLWWRAPVIRKYTFGGLLRRETALNLKDGLVEFVFLTNGMYVAGASGRTLYVWRTDSLDLIFTIKCAGVITCLCAIDGGAALAVGLASGQTQLIAPNMISVSNVRMPRGSRLVRPSTEANAS